MEISEEEREEFETVWLEEDRFSGLDVGYIVQYLRRRKNWSREKIMKFGQFFIEEGLRSGWLIADRPILLDELSFQPLPFDRG